MTDSVLQSCAAVFDHAAIAARRLRDLLPLYRDVLGGEFLAGDDNPRVGFRGLQLRYPDGTRIELMEPLAGSTFFDRFFAGKGEGLHHITFKVPDIHLALEVVERHGLPTFGVYLDDPHWKEVFIHPKNANGVLVQLGQASPGGTWGGEDQSLEKLIAGRGLQGNGIPSP
ncbi:MAG: VOC family protein [Acidimicrobiia bacterium]